MIDKRHKRAYQFTHPGQFAGKTMLDRMEEHLDELVKAIKEGSKDSSITELRGEASGMVWCIAMWINPYEPDYKAVRVAANKRYKKSLEGK